MFNAMAGQTNLKVLIRSMEPKRNPGYYVFCTTTEEIDCATEKILLSFREPEGLTLVLLREDADAMGLLYNYISCWITLNVQSSLEAVGFTAFFSRLLAENGIGCNVVAAYFHDHIFVPAEKAELALDLLQKATS
jgi:hypothetical protein